jgi:hypothetical protein
LMLNLRQIVLKLYYSLTKKKGNVGKGKNWTDDYVVLVGKSCSFFYTTEVYLL